ncbi:sulfur carrier protein ThiS [Desulfonema magnum]|uniref:Sulfur carrier ThiS/MoaD-like family protein n=1 Tax=Desulfonema magnum TaxID=45655 RepID=A0A975GNI4_9BACT|nr:MoaD/ThiS family protein [Desulfonema magnum]QTA88001.1 Sulfur carrier ThiS/MoaD-like family protein [Desulfonema magnum]
MNKKINIILNGFKEKVRENATISFLIAHFKEGDTDLIVEHNGRFVYPHEYSDMTLSEKDSIEFINPNFGG